MERVGEATGQRETAQGKTATSDTGKQGAGGGANLSRRGRSRHDADEPRKLEGTQLPEHRGRNRVGRGRRQPVEAGEHKSRVAGAEAAPAKSPMRGLTPATPPGWRATEGSCRWGTTIVASTVRHTGAVTAARRETLPGTRRPTYTEASPQDLTAVARPQQLCLPHVTSLAGPAEGSNSQRRPPESHREWISRGGEGGSTARATDPPHCHHPRAQHCFATSPLAATMRGRGPPPAMARVSRVALEGSHTGPFWIYFFNGCLNLGASNELSFNLSPSGKKVLRFALHRNISHRSARLPSHY